MDVHACIIPKKGRNCCQLPFVHNVSVDSMYVCCVDGNSLHFCQCYLEMECVDISVEYLTYVRVYTLSVVM